MSYNKRKKEWPVEKHRKQSPQLDKTLKYLDKKHRNAIILTIILSIVIAFISGYLISNHFNEESKRDLQTKYDSLLIEHNETQERIELALQGDRNLFQEVINLKILLNETDNETLERIIYEETGYTFNQIKEKAELFNEVAESYYDLGLAFSVLGDFSKAVEYFDKAMKAAKEAEDRIDAYDQGKLKVVSLEKVLQKYR